MEATARVLTMPAPEKKPRRKNRCMFKDDKGRWWLDYYTPDGKRRRKMVGESKREAETLLAKLRVDKARGEYVDQSSAPPFDEFCVQFMERHGNHKRSYAKCEGTIEKLKEFFGSLRLSQITAGHIERYRLMRLAEKSHRNPERSVSRTSVNREVEIIRAMLNKAVRWGMLARNPACQVQDYDENNYRERFLSTAEIRKLLKVTKQSESPALRPAVYLALQTGMRKAELLSLRWMDINFEADKILVRETKNGEPRQVPIGRRARWLLNKLAARNPLAEFVFESQNAKGERAPARDIKRAWHTALRLARIEDFRFHDLRRTFASHFAMRRGDLYALAKILGHKNPKITIDRYAHLSPEFIQAQRGAIDAMYAIPASNGHRMDTEGARVKAAAV